MAWCFVEENSAVYVLDLNQMQRSIPVVDISEGPKICTIKIKFNDGSVKLVDLKNMDTTSGFSKDFSKACSSRTAFVKLFKERVQEMQSHDNITDDVIFTSNEQESIGNVSATSSYIARDKIMDECVKCHISNLKPPTDECLLRPLNMAHVEALRINYLRGGFQFKVMVGVLKKGDINKASVLGGVEIEIIGGNHTRAALKSLYDTNMFTEDVLVTVYKNNLSCAEILSVGFFHNKIDDGALSMSFIDRARVIRKIKTRTKKWSSEAAMVFGFKSASEARNKLRTMASLADVADEVWSMAEPLCIRDQVKQTAFSKFVTLSKDTQLKLLTKWEEKGVKAYKEEIKCLNVSVNKEPSIAVETESDDLVISYEAHSDVMENNLEQEVEKLKKENERKDAIVHKLQSDNTKLKEENNNNVKIIKDLRKELKKMSDLLTKNNIMKENVPQEKRKKMSFEVNEKVWGFFAPHKKFYPATIVDFCNGKYKIIFIEDGVIEYVDESEVKKY